MTDIQTQLSEQRRSVDFDTYDIVAQQIVSMVESKAIHIAPEYQRKFRWDEDRSSELIESLLLGIPIPSLFMATNSDSTWELVDGVQRIGSIIKFSGNEELRQRLNLGDSLKLNGLQKLNSFNGLSYNDLTAQIKLHFHTRPLKVVTLSDKSDKAVRFDLFERLNRGGISLSSQEIRDCVYRGEFSDFLKELAKNKDFKTVLKLPASAEKDGSREECVLRFFAFLNSYKKFDHSVIDYLNTYMSTASEKFNYINERKRFEQTFFELAKLFPTGLRRPGRKGTTSLILFEGVTVGAALALKKNKKLNAKGINKWLGSNDFINYTTGATNSLKSVIGRVEFARDQFLKE